MMDVSLRIKNLSVALEAVSSSILNLDNYKRISRLEALLDDAITQAEKYTTKAVRSTELTFNDESPF